MQTSSHRNESAPETPASSVRDEALRDPVRHRGPRALDGPTTVVGLARKRRTHTMDQHSEAQDSFPNPRGSVVGVLTDDETFEDARRRLEQSGFEHYDVL